MFAHHLVLHFQEVFIRRSTLRHYERVTLELESGLLEVLSELFLLHHQILPIVRVLLIQPQIDKLIRYFIDYLPALLVEILQIKVYVYIVSHEVNQKQILLC